MAQSALTVTPPNPTPPTNMPFHGATPPNVPNFTKTTYANPFNLDANNKPQAPYGVNPAPAPYADVDASTAGALGTFAAAASASASGTGATSGGTEDSYPGTGTTSVNRVGAVPAASSVAHEGAGTEVSVLAPGNIVHTYPGAVTHNTSQSVSTGLVVDTLAKREAGPNATHLSSDSVAPTSAPTITGLLPVAPVSNAGGGTTPLTVNGTNFRNGAVVNIAGIPYQTQYNSATQLKVMNAPVRTAAGNTAITVRVGATTTSATNWVFS